MAKRHQVLLISAVLCSCATQESWTCDTLPGAIDSSRLTYISKEDYPPMHFQMLKIGDQVEAFISLQRFHFTSNNVTVEFKIGEDIFEDTVAVHEGKMRIRLHPETCQRIIQALQLGQDVGILVDGFEEKLDAARFSNSFSKFLGESYF